MSPDRAQLLETHHVSSNNRPIWGTQIQLEFVSQRMTSQQFVPEKFRMGRSIQCHRKQVLEPFRNYAERTDATAHLIYGRYKNLDYILNAQI